MEEVDLILAGAMGFQAGSRVGASPPQFLVQVWALAMVL